MGGRFIQSVKRHLPAKSFQSTWIRDKERTIEEIVGAFLRHLKLAVDERAGESVTRVVLGRPA
jgi:molecular chaperone DnaK (HSP70)